MEAETATPGTARKPFYDPDALMRIKGLEFRARAVMQGFWSGMHRSPRHGFSAEFTEYRPYVEGDDLRFLDWRLYARSDRYYLKKFEDETNLACHFLVDGSRSMQFASGGHSKAEYARTLAATLAWFLHQQGDATGLIRFSETLDDHLPARGRLNHLRRLFASLDHSSPAGGTNLTEPLSRVPQLIRKRGILVLISDFLTPLEKLERMLSEWAVAGHEISAFQILDPREIDFDFGEAAVFRDSESGREIYIDPQTAGKRYREKMQLHCEALERTCTSTGVHYHRFPTDRPLEFALFDYLQDRSRRKPLTRVRR